MTTSHWRPSRRMRRIAPRVDRYYDHCERLAGDRHDERPYVKRYRWETERDNARIARANLAAVRAYQENTAQLTA